MNLLTTEFYPTKFIFILIGGNFYIFLNDVFAKIGRKGTIDANNCFFVLKEEGNAFICAFNQLLDISTGVGTFLLKKDEILI
jgi:hypothetical protein